MSNAHITLKSKSWAFEQGWLLGRVLNWWLWIHNKFLQSCNLLSAVHPSPAPIYSGRESTGVAVKHILQERVEPEPRRWWWKIIFVANVTLEREFKSLKKGVYRLTRYKPLAPAPQFNKSPFHTFSQPTKCQNKQHNAPFLSFLLVLSAQSILKKTRQAFNSNRVDTAPYCG